jgi:hypothetical protein
MGGWMAKKSPRLLGGWSQRFFTVRDAGLVYFDSQVDTHQQVCRRRRRRRRRCCWPCPALLCWAPKRGTGTGVALPLRLALLRKQHNTVACRARRRRARSASSRSRRPRRWSSLRRACATRTASRCRWASACSRCSPRATTSCWGALPSVHQHVAASQCARCCLCRVERHTCGPRLQPPLCVDAFVAHALQQGAASPGGARLQVAVRDG